MYYIIINYYGKGCDSEPMLKEQAEVEFEIIHFQFRLGLRDEPELVKVPIKEPLQSGQSHYK